MLIIYGVYHFLQENENSSHGVLKEIYFVTQSLKEITNNSTVVLKLFKNHIIIIMYITVVLPIKCFNVSSMQ